MFSRVTLCKARERLSAAKQEALRREVEQEVAAEFAGRSFRLEGHVLESVIAASLTARILAEAGAPSESEFKVCWLRGEEPHLTGRQDSA